MDKAKDEPIEFVKMIVSRMTKGRVSQEDFDDMVGEGLIGLADAINKFDDSKGAKFSTYAEWRVRGAIIDARRHKNGRNGQKDIVDLFEPYDEDDKQSIEDIAIYDVDPTERLIVNESISKLPEREQKILDLSLQGYTLQEIGDSVDLSNCRISQLSEEIFSTIENDIHPQRVELRMEENQFGKKRTPEVIERQRKVAELYNQVPKLSRKEIAEKLNMKLVTVNNDIVYLTGSRRKNIPKQPHIPPPKYTPPEEIKKDFRDEIAHILRKNNVKTAKINIILGLIDL